MITSWSALLRAMALAWIAIRNLLVFRLAMNVLARIALRGRL